MRERWRGDVQRAQGGRRAALSSGFNTPVRRGTAGEHGSSQSKPRAACCWAGCAHGWGGRRRGGAGLQVGGFGTRIRRRDNARRQGKRTPGAGQRPRRGSAQTKGPTMQTRTGLAAGRWMLLRPRTSLQAGQGDNGPAARERPASWWLSTARCSLAHWQSTARRTDARRRGGRKKLPATSFFHDCSFTRIHGGLLSMNALAVSLPGSSGLVSLPSRRLPRLPQLLGESFRKHAGLPLTLDSISSPQLRLRIALADAPPPPGEPQSMRPTSPPLTTIHKMALSPKNSRALPPKGPVSARSPPDVC